MEGGSSAALVAVVQQVRYAPRRITYRTLDRAGTEVLRLSFRPRRVLAAGRALPRRSTLARAGYTVRALGRDTVLRVRRAGVRSAEIIG